MMNRRYSLRVRIAQFLGCCVLLVCGGCQTMSQIPGMGSMISSKGEKKIQKMAKNDPFPSPSDVGLKVSPK